MITGVLFALAAGLVWGLVFVAPLLLPQYPAAMQSFGRYLAFGLIALPLACWDLKHLRQLERADWLEAAKLALVGNVLYYICLASAIQHAGAPLPTLIIGALPVVITLASNWRAAHSKLPWGALLPSLLLMLCGIGLVHHAEWQAQASMQGAGAPAPRYALGAVLALGAVACWTWYPLRNAQWLRAHTGRSARAWATAQGLSTLPLAVLGYAGLWLWLHVQEPGFAMPLGPTPLRFVLLMFAIGLLASWLGTLCWNEASQRLPAQLSGQLIVFETLAALVYAYLLRRQWPPAEVLLGATLLVGGVLLALQRLHAQAGRRRTA